MLTRIAVQEIIFQALNNINDERSPVDQLVIEPETRLFGTDAALDSLSLVSVIVDVEGAVTDAVGRDICLTDDQAMSQAVSPFTDVKSLTDYILRLLSENA